MVKQRKKKAARDVRESDLAQDRMGDNSLQGNDQLSTRNERQAVPDVKQQPDDLIESFEKLDKEKRARADLGKGQRSKGGGIS